MFKFKFFLGIYPQNYTKNYNNKLNHTYLKPALHLHYQKLPCADNKLLYFQQKNPNPTIICFDVLNER